MENYLAVLNELVARWMVLPEIEAIALSGDGDETMLLVVSSDPDKFLGNAERYFGDSQVENGATVGGTLRRNVTLAGVKTQVIIVRREGLENNADIPQTTLIEVYDPTQIISGIQQKLGINVPDFASTHEISKFGDISTAFFETLGLGNAAFISDGSTLNDWCDSSGQLLANVNARIHEVYGVDVSDLSGGKLTEIFKRIREGPYYQRWAKECSEPPA